jgi:uroporphyrinogen-III synthase
MKLLKPLESRNINVSEQYVKSLPLEGKRILVTRSREQAGALSERLQALGAVPVEFPVIRIMPPQNWEPLDSALGKLFLADAKNLPYYAWLIFTSANGVNIFCERLLSLGFHTENMLGVRVAAIGPATAAALARYDITADLVPDEYIAESVAAALIEDTQQREESLEGKRILLPRAAEARQVLVTELEQAGAVVDVVAAYTTVAAAGDDEQGREVLHLLQNGQIDIITFTSSSTVRNFMQWLTSCVGESGSKPGDHEGRHYISSDIRNVVASLVDARSAELKIACIGPITSQTAREVGLKVDIEAREFTIDGLVEAIVQSEG